MPNSAFHEGELALQQRADESLTAARNAVVIKDAIPGKALPFIRQQPMFVAASQDSEGGIWASFVLGQPGFLEPANDGRSLRILLSETARQRWDPFWRNIEERPRIGILIIDPGTRRRLRVNGRATPVSADQLLVEIDEAYPNCPKYIQRRNIRQLAGGSPLINGYKRNGAALDSRLSEMIRGADTFFVASMHAERGLDASHRGGNPGFVRVLDEATLKIPDYPGNGMFNTLGNLAVNPSAGLAFPNFEKRRLLQLTGTAEILWDQPDKSGESGGTGRFWNFKLHSWLETELPNSVGAEFIDYSPFNPRPEQGAAR
jgi:predicted pyridoxine 5'-phosphate oxidase superfamily flavin-nucleotide-binding protein